jgi:hypothetical protein
VRALLVFVFVNALVPITLVVATPRPAAAQGVDAGVPDAAPVDAPAADPRPAPPPATPSAPTAPAPTDPAPSAPAASCTATIDGHAVDAATHEAIAGATVRVDQRPVTETDANGRFSLRRMCPGALTVEVERVDYVPARRTITLGTGTPGKPRKPVSLELELEAYASEVIVVKDKAPDPTSMR